MRQTKFTTQIYSLFGAGYVLEAHNPDSVGRSKQSPRKRNAVLAVLILGVSTAAGAIATTSWHRPADAEVWAQETPASVLKLPGGFGVDDAVY